MKAKNENVNMILQSFQMMKNLVIYFSCECMNIKMFKSLQNVDSASFIFAKTVSLQFVIIFTLWQIGVKFT